MRLLAPSLTVLVLAGACTNDFDGLAVSDDSSTGTAPPSSSGEGASAATSTGSPSSGPGGVDPAPGGSGGTAPDVKDAGGAGGAESGGVGAGGTPPSGAPGCAEQYATVMNEMCVENETRCAFNFPNASQSCGGVCQAAGGECVEAYSDEPSNCEWDPAAPLGCGYVGYGDAICVCSRGCGGKAACVSPSICVAGSCS